MRKQVIRSNLEDLIDLLREARSADPRVASATAQYACVSANGHLEEYLKNSMVDFFRNRCDPNALRIVKKSVAGYYNFKQERVILFFNEMRPDRKEAVKGCFLVRENLGDALGSIVGNKNTVGHTGTSSITPIRVIQWLEEVVGSLDELDRAGF